MYIYWQALPVYNQEKEEALSFNVIIKESHENQVKSYRITQLVTMFQKL